MSARSSLACVTNGLGSWDLQAHRGGMGLRPENTMAAFRHALEIGVTTLECDVNIAADGVPMVTHDRVVDGAKFTDTAPVSPNDPDFPYVGSFVCRLSSEQLASLDADHALPQFPEQRTGSGARMPAFAEVLALAKEHQVRVNVEAKFDVLHPSEVAPRRVFVDQTLAVIEAASMVDLVSIQSFDWQVLRMVGWASPRTRRYALTAPKYLAVGQPGASAWLADLDIDDFRGDVVEAVAFLGFDAISPVHGEPFVCGPGDPGYRPFLTEDLVVRARRHGLGVVPYTVDSDTLMAAHLDLGVDGFITNYPDRARRLLAERGIPLSSRP